MCAEAFAEIDLIRTGGDERAAAGHPHRQRAASTSAPPATPPAAGMGTTVTAALVERRRPRRLRQRRRQPRLPAARRRPAAADRGPLGGGRAGAPAARSRPRTRPSTTRSATWSRACSAPSRPSRWTPSGWTRADGDLVLLCSDGLTDMVLERGPGRLLADEELLRADRASSWCGRRWRRRRGQRHRGAVSDRPARRGRAARAGARCSTTRPRSRAATDERPPAAPARCALLRALAVPALIGGWAGAVAGCAGRTSSAPTRPPATSPSTRACRSTCSPASSSTTRCQSTNIAYASLDQATRKQLFDHRLRSRSDAVSAANAGG